VFATMFSPAPPDETDVVLRADSVELRSTGLPVLDADSVIPTVVGDSLFVVVDGVWLGVDGAVSRSLDVVLRLVIYHCQQAIQRNLSLVLRRIVLHGRLVLHEVIGAIRGRGLGNEGSLPPTYCVSACAGWVEITSIRRTSGS
jgi:hypothetical protein